MTAIKHTKEKGFTLLFAVLLAVLVLAVGASVINIAMKQVILTGIGRESQFAFYAANTGVECALYWDYRDEKIFATSTLSSQYTKDDEYTSSVLCGAQSIYKTYEGVDTDVYVLGESGTTKGISRFTIKFEDSIQYCSVVTVTKEKIGDDPIKTTIESRGYNTCDEGNPRRIERGLQLSY